MKDNIKYSILPRPSKKTLLFGMALSAFIGLIAFLPILLRNNGQYMEYGDYFIQYVPFIKELKRMAASGSLAWSWNSFLGDSFVEAYSYYTVFNPLAWLVALFPAKYILYGTLLATLIKLSLATLSATLFIRCFTKKDSSALVGALLYTFSGFTAVNTYFYFFIDIIAIFPFILWGLEKLMVEKKRAPYVLAVFANAAINLYLFVSSVVITVIYVFFRLELWRGASWKREFGTLLQIALWSVVGTGLASAAIIPSLNAVTGSSKAAGSFSIKLTPLFWAQKTLDHLRTLVSPADSCMNHSFYTASLWSSTAVHLPIFGSFCVLQRASRKRDKLTFLCIFLTVCYFVPLLNGAFSLWTSTYYTRWLYGMALVFSLATVKFLEECEEEKSLINKKLFAGYTIFTAVLLVFPTAIYLLYSYGIDLTSVFANACYNRFFIGYPRLFVLLALTLINFIMLWGALKAKLTSRSLIPLAAFACCLNLFVYNEINYDLHSADASYSNDEFYTKTMIEGSEAEGYEFEWRIDHPSEIRNYGLFKNYASVNYFNSLQNPNASRFAAAVGIGESSQDTILLTPDDGGEYTNALLSVRYFYDYDGKAYPPDGYTLVKNENGVRIFENNNYIPMGMTYDSFAVESRVNSLSPKDRAHLMLSSLVVSDEDAITAYKYLKSATSVNVTESLEALAEERRDGAADYFKGTSRGFEAQITLERDNIVFFSVPYDEGFEIKVNGRRADALEVNYGLLGVVCPAGTSEITAVYHTKGLWLGIGLSAVTAALWCGGEIFYKIKLNRKKRSI